MHTAHTGYRSALFNDSKDVKHKSKDRKTAQTAFTISMNNATPSELSFNVSMRDTEDMCNTLFH